MVDRKNVAVEKMDRAVQMLKENQIDMWMFYSRLNQDPSLELMFNTDTKMCIRDRGRTRQYSKRQGAGYL